MDYHKERRSSVDWQPKDKGKKKKKKDKNKGLSGTTQFTQNPGQWYKERETKGNVNNTALKTAVEVVAAGGVVAYLSAACGKYATIIGSVLVAVGNYSDDTGLVKALGLGMVGNGIGKAKEYSENPDQTVQQRIAAVKDDLGYAFLIKKYSVKPATVSGVEPPKAPPQKSSVSNISKNEKEQDDLPDFSTDEALKALSGIKPINKPFPENPYDLGFNSETDPNDDSWLINALDDGD